FDLVRSTLIENWLKQSLHLCPEPYLIVLILLQILQFGLKKIFGLILLPHLPPNGHPQKPS
ncbi:hypothetical protein, partial [Nostoc linckia]